MATTRTIACPSCGGRTLTATPQIEAFEYLDGNRVVTLEAHVDVFHCPDCGLDFTDSRAERARNIAVAAYLSIPSAEQVRSLRQQYGLTRSEFAQITGIGEASLARWESGVQLPTKALALLLRLLAIPENFRLALERRSVPFPDCNVIPLSAHAKAREEVPQSRFKCVRKTPELESIARRFQLQCTS